MESIKVSATILTSPQKLYKAWLDSREHSKFTGSEARIVPKVGGGISAWDGYIKGKITELVPGKKIVQTWRSSDFSPADEDSILSVIFKKVKNGTKITSHHKNISNGQGDSYKKGWKEFYFSPMTKYFSS